MTRILATAATAVAAFGLVLSAPLAAQASAGHHAGAHATTRAHPSGLCLRHGPIQIGLCR